jgi:butyryl-CoA dehydrogenase
MEVIEKVENTNRTAIIPGGSFLIANPAPADCFFPEDFTEEHRQIAQTTADFALNEVVAASDAIEAKDFAVTRRLIKPTSASPPSTSPKNTAVSRWTR